MSTALRITLVLGAAATIITVLMGPAWRGSFYRSWLRPRLLAFGIIITAMTAGMYLFRVVNAVHAH